MITWRDEGDRSVAMLGEHEVGEARGADRHDWSVYFGMAAGTLHHTTYHPTLEAAKSALEAAVADWVKRAALQPIPPDQTITGCTAIEAKWIAS